MIEYELLKIIWWVLVGVLLIGFALTDGFDMGSMAIMPFVGKTDNERRAAINTIAPHWDGNQVWFITAGGALFAAWPMVYAVAFSGMYWALLLVLFALFLRPVGFDYRSKLENTQSSNTGNDALLKEFQEIKQILNAILHKEGTITLNGTKMGTAMAVGSYKVQ